jgi:hypothetical protein
MTKVNFTLRQIPFAKVCTFQIDRNERILDLICQFKRSLTLQSKEGRRGGGRVLLEAVSKEM